MSINEKLYNSPATNGAIAGASIRTSTALDAITDALELIAAGMPNEPAKTAEIAERIHMQIALIRESSKGLDEAFDRLTGWNED